MAYEFESISLDSNSVKFDSAFFITLETSVLNVEILSIVLNKMRKASGDMASEIWSETLRLLSKYAS